MEREFNIYHEIVDSKDSYFTDPDAVTADVFSTVVSECKKGDVFNLHVNSPGGSVFAAVTMTSIIKNLRQKGVTVNAYIDGLAASAASFLVMACDNIYCYPTSMLMIHKPMSAVFGNADEMLEQAELLEKIEESTCMPLYTEKAKVDNETIRSALAAETWLSAQDMSEMFDIEIIDGEGMIDFVDPAALKDFKYIPTQLLQLIEAKEDEEDEPDENEESKDGDESGEDEPDKGESDDEDPDGDNSDDPNEESEEDVTKKSQYYDLLIRTIKSI